ncbi:MAG: PEP-CTERM sorting domain-containing protein [Opitutales bacterium]|nr:PEP-CTERM sorting domain-containing protein [Opitutales bacterium]
MKKYITLAALLAAGTTFANAETIVFGIERSGDTITFSGLDATDFGLSYTNWTYNGGGNHNDGAWQTPTNAAYQNTFSPDAQLRSGQTDSWTMKFTFTNDGTEDVVLTQFAFDCYGINGGGSDKNAAIPVTLTLGYNGESVSSSEFNLGYAGETNVGTISFGEGGLEVSAGGSVEFALTMGGAKSYNTYSGITGGSFTTIPEPSAFGMLAGLGALALVASRRRRK